MIKEMSEVRVGQVATGGRPPKASIRKVWIRNAQILLANWKMILLSSVIISIGVGVYAFVWMPNWYKSTSRVLPARTSGGLLDNLAGGLSATIKDLGVTKLGGGSAANTYTPLALLDSRELRERMIRQFNLTAEYHSKSMDDALSEFGEHVSGDLVEEGYYLISFEDQDSLRAAGICDSLVAGINDINSSLASQEARENFRFVEQRYQKNIVDLDSAETALGAFQTKYGLYMLPEQAKAELSGIAAIEQQKTSTELQLHTAEQLYGPQSAEAQVLRSTLSEISGKLGELNAGVESKAPSYFVPTKLLPDVALLYLRLMREVEIQSKLKAFILPTYEQAKLDQAKRTLAFLTLDHAKPAEKKSKPHRSIIVLLAFLSSLVIIIALVLLFQARRVFFTGLRSIDVLENRA